MKPYLICPAYFGHAGHIVEYRTRHFAPDKNNKEKNGVEVDLIFRIAAIGIVVAVLNLLLSRSGRDEQALMTTIAGLVVVLVMVVREIYDLFELIKALFGF